MKFALAIAAFLTVCLTSSSTAFVVPRTTHVSSSLSRSIPTPTTAFHESSSSTKLSALPEIVDGAIKMASSITSGPLFEYFLQTVISYAVPAFFTIVTIFFAAMSFRKGGDGNDFSFMDRDTAVSELYSDLYGDTKNEGPGGRGGGGRFNFGRSNGLSKSQRRNLGIPEMEYLKVTNLNERYDSYDFSLTKATKSKAYAASKYRSKSFDRALQVALAGDEGELPAYAKTSLLQAEKEFLQTGKNLVAEIQRLEAALTQETIDKELKRLGMKEFEMDPKPDDVIDAEIESSNTTVTANKTIFQKIKGDKSGKSDLLQSVSKLQRELKQVELDFVQDVIAAVGTKRGLGIRAALLGDISARGSGGLLTQLEGRPLSAILQSGAPEDQRKSLFVMRFPGDVQASQLNELREEVTAIIRNAKPGDEALVVLQSGGGTVTGYGLAGGQLVRLKQAGIYLTMAVEQVAASGGYLMACVADRIIASPFAVLGSIGVISEIPNAYERLKQEGIEFQTVTAGKFKRTLTPTKKISKQDLEKSKEDLEAVLTQFSGFVKENRPQLDMDEVATGETWFGNAALDKGLCDAIQTVDDILLNYVDLGYNVYELDYSPPPAVPEGLAQFFPVGGESATSSSSRSEGGSLARRAVRWVAGAVAEEVRAAIQEQGSAENRVMAKDDTSDRFQMRD